jgi:hypothetical protein
MCQTLGYMQGIKEKIRIFASTVLQPESDRYRSIHHCKATILSQDKHSPFPKERLPTQSSEPKQLLRRADQARRGPHVNICFHLFPVFFWGSNCFCSCNFPTATSFPQTTQECYIRPSPNKGCFPKELKGFLAGPLAQKSYARNLCTFSTK